MLVKYCPESPSPVPFHSPVKLKKAFFLKNRFFQSKSDMPKACLPKNGPGFPENYDKKLFLLVCKKEPERQTQGFVLVN
ncbi:hypothetical protein X474_00155 [Dethiosulfatarculus sandiegensis]|uniref:Uncharacterized protein n=1 Tax=Dethiosulfatarculus sandiegensis TaxID=1429043 RepID=A0A0D2JCY2_9BACT|nr:hypothetical protein X474_00155 [Dethiosulfatarculus sandiegensis]